MAHIVQSEDRMSKAMLFLTQIDFTVHAQTWIEIKKSADFNSGGCSALN